MNFCPLSKENLLKQLRNAQPIKGDMQIQDVNAILSTLSQLL